MAHIIADRVRETSTTAGTGSLTLAGAVSGFRTFASVMTPPSDTCDYMISMGANWEVGVGTLTASATLARTTVLASSNAGAAVNFAAGTKDVGLAVSASKLRTSISANANPMECRLVFVSTTQIRLDRFNGSYVTIGGYQRQVASSGPTLSNSGLTSSTTYYIYATWSGSAVALEASTTVYAIDTATGLPVKSGDTSRTLVGMIRTFGTNFADTTVNRLVASYFNRRGRPLLGVFSSPTTTSTTLTELDTAQRVGFLVWADEGPDLSIDGYASNNTVNGFTAVNLGIDGSDTGAFSLGTSATANASVPVAVRGTTINGTAVGEGYHFASVLGKVGANTGSFSTYINGLVQI